MSSTRAKRARGLHTSARRRSRRQTAHDLKRRLMRKLRTLAPYVVTRIIRDLREFAIAREFMEGRGFDQLEADATLGRHVWTRAEIEQAVRNQARRAI